MSNFKKLFLMGCFVILSMPCFASKKPNEGHPSCPKCENVRCPKPKPEDDVICGVDMVLDVCGCCPVCPLSDGDSCLRDSHETLTRPCGFGTDCIMSADGSADDLNGVCTCPITSQKVCGSDGVLYETVCQFHEAQARAKKSHDEPVYMVRGDSPCLTRPKIIKITPTPHLVKVGENVSISCEGVGYPTPGIVWTREVGEGGFRDDLPGDEENVSIQTRGGPTSHSTTAWLSFSPLKKEDVASYSCHAINNKGADTKNVELTTSLDKQRGEL
ncbi:insulin-like growth factor-binding protein-like 1 [Symsagittifera roscoffensis]|uniref:insulin-like growth factor-binding protein-like 1 n=1 Tax=Symsagittifera roscoffensis TaxID=84072 RepID=UPI00307C1317